MTDFDNCLEENVLKLSGRAKQCGRNAFRHLRCAWKLCGADNEMAAFRAITAEEEAATALLWALKQKQYPGSQHLNLRNHLHKSAITPFLRAAELLLAKINFAKPTFVLSRGIIPPRLSIRLDMTNCGLKLSDSLIAEPDEPLNFSVYQRPSDGAMSEYMFVRELEGVMQSHGLADMKKFLEEEANTRNKLLYASDTEIPIAHLKREFILERYRRVKVMLTITIAILQTPIQQLFADQCLKAFLRLVGKFSEQSVMDIPDMTGNWIEIVKIYDQEPVANVHVNMSVSGNISYQFLPEWVINYNYLGGQCDS